MPDSRISTEQIKHRNDQPRQRRYEVGVSGYATPRTFIASRIEHDDKGGAVFLNDANEIVFLVGPGCLQYVLASELAKAQAAAA